MRLLMACLLLFYCTAFANPNLDPSERLIVVLQDNQDPEEFAKALYIKPDRIFTSGLKGFTVDSEQLVAGFIMLETMPEVLMVERDQVIELGDTPTMVDTEEGQTKPWGIERVGTFNCRRKHLCRKRRAWVIDTGIDLDHPDLKVDKKNGFSAFTDEDGEPKSPDDGHSHGTHVAGTIAAIDNKEGVVGVAAGAKVVPVQVLNKWGRGTTSTVIAGIDHVVSHAKRGDVANMSLGGGPSEALDAAVLKASEKLIFVLAAGNQARDADGSSPARVNGKNIYTISAIDEENNLAYFSNYGEAVDKAEPGVRVLSTIKNGKYGTYSGTSMAAPHAAGILLRKGSFGKTCEPITGDRDEQIDCVGTLPEIRRRH